MTFTTDQFVCFFVVVYALYLALLRWHRAQNLLLLGASYWFYACWDHRFLSLILVSTMVDYWIGRGLGATSRPWLRRTLLATSVTGNLALLGVFKYYGFFAEGLFTLLHSIGFESTPTTLQIVLPVGISFYTFQTIGYTIDVYRGDVPPERRLLDFALFVGFFPQLVAGPIERASRLLPQITSPRTIRPEQVRLGLFLLVWGTFKKVVVADGLAVIANEVFNSHATQPGFALTVGAIAFTFQIYCDFSAYSDIARGLCKLMGFELMVNFRLPYMAGSPAEFWRRWHISLSQWLRDYLYVPLGGNRGGNIALYRNLLLTMLLGGLWHGASWHFVVWGAYQGTLLIGHRLCVAIAPQPGPTPTRLGRVLRPFQVTTTFALVVIGWVLFRSTTLEQAWQVISHASFVPTRETARLWEPLLALLAPLLLVQTLQHLTRDLAIVARLPSWALGTACGVLIVAMLALADLGPGGGQTFIYFQF